MAAWAVALSTATVQPASAAIRSLGNGNCRNRLVIDMSPGCRQDCSVSKSARAAIFASTSAMGAGVFLKIGSNGGMDSSRLVRGIILPASLSSGASASADRKEPAIGWVIPAVETFPVRKVCLVTAFLQS